MGTVAYSTLADDIALGATPDGWADEGWVRMIQGGQNYLLNSPVGENIEVLLRSIDLITMSRPKALLWQTQIRLGPTQQAATEESVEPQAGGTAGGTLIGSGLN
jgi:hypothetical protein|eukprot:COSAG01_NODE_9051_length_2569_cov_12.122672_3_plen_104_part_00